MSIHAMAMLHSSRSSDVGRGSERSLPAGTWKRVFAFAAPYRLELSIFLVVIVLDASSESATQCWPAGIINGGHGARPAAGCGVDRCGHCRIGGRRRVAFTSHALVLVADR